MYCDCFILCNKDEDNTWGPTLTSLRYMCCTFVSFCTMSQKEWIQSFHEMPEICNYMYPMIVPKLPKWKKIHQSFCEMLKIKLYEVSWDIWINCVNIYEVYSVFYVAITCVLSWQARSCPSSPPREATCTWYPTASDPSCSALALRYVITLQGVKAYVKYVTCAKYVSDIEVRITLQGVKACVKCVACIKYVTDNNRGSLHWGKCSK